MNSSDRLKVFKVDREERLDKWLQSKLQVPRNQVENLIKNIGIKVDGKVTTKCGLKLKLDQVVKIDLPPTNSEDLAYKVDFDIDVIYEDSDLLILNKPPFLVVHLAPSVKEATVVDWLKKRGISLSTLSGKERHGIVHRIDKETSGALVIAKNNPTHQHLSNQLQDRSMGRYYLAIIDLPLKEDMVINKPIFRHPTNRLKMTISQNGRDAKSAFVKLATSKDKKYELIACKLFSGRTHQIRVHLESISRHILADKLYGFKSKKDNIPRVMLHAYLIYFNHPASGKKIIKEAPLFKDFKTILYNNFNKEEIDEKLDSNYIISRFSSMA